MVVVKSSFCRRRNLVRWLLSWCLLLVAFASGGAVRANTVRVLSLQSNDLVYSRATGRLYASVSDKNAVLPVLPLSGASEAEIPVGPQPLTLALSGDGRVLYVGLHGANALGEGEVTRVVLNDGPIAPGATSRFSLGKSSFGPSFYASDLAVDPANANVVAVARTQQNGFREDVSIYDTGVRRPQGSDWQTRPDRITFSSNPATASLLYGADQTGTFRTMTVDALGITQSSAGNLLLRDSDIVAAPNSVVYATSGRVINAISNKLLFTLPAGPVTPDFNHERVFVLSRNSNFDTTWILSAYTANGYRLIGQMQIPGVNGNAANLVRWGTDGLAFRTDGGQIFLIQTALTSAYAQNPTPLVPPFSPAPGVRVLSLPTNDLIYDATRGKIWMSVPSRAGSNGNSLISFDPVSGALGYPAWIGSEPTRLARSDDGQFLYCALNGAGSVAKFWLSSGQGGGTFYLSNDPANEPYFAEDIEVVPGQANSVAVARRSAGGPAFNQRVALYDNGAVRANTSSSPNSGGERLEFGASASRLYSMELNSSHYFFYRMSLGSNGVTLDHSFTNLIGGNAKFANGAMYLPWGRIVNPETEAIVGQYDGVAGNYDDDLEVIPDAANNRIYFLSHDFSSNQAIIRAYNLSTRVAGGTYTVNNVTRPSTFIRWGNDGFAFRVADKVYFVQTSTLTDSTAPIVSISAPAHNRAYSSMPNPSGRVTDESSAIARVDISIRRQSDNLYWNGSAWTANEVLLQAGIDPAGPTGGTWFRSNLFPAGTVLDEGAYDFKVYGRDAAANVGTAQSTFTIDRTAPSGVVTVPVHNSAVNTFAEIRGAASDNQSGVATVQFGLFRNDGLWWNGTAWVGGLQWLNATADGETWKLAGSLPTGANLADGPYNVVQRVVDNAGNVYQTPGDKVTRFILDTAAPATQLFYLSGTPASGWYRSQAAIGMQANDNGSGVAKIMYSLDGAEPTVFVPGSVLNITGNGVHPLRYWAVDKAGNEETPRTVDIKIDGAAPSGVITQPVTNSMLRSFPSIRGTASDAHSGVGTVQFGISRNDGLWWNGTAWVGGLQWQNATLDGAEWVLSSGLPAGADLQNGSYRIAQRVVDVAGNEYLTPFQNLTAISIDASAPVSRVQLDAPTPVNNWYRGTVRAWIHAQDVGLGIDKIYYSLDGGATQVFSTTQPQPVVIEGNGVHTLRFWAVDRAGNEETPQSIEVKIDVALPSGTITQPVANSAHTSFPTIRGTASDAHSGVATVQFGITRNDGQWWNGTAWIANNEWLNATAQGAEWVLNSGLPSGDNLTSGGYRITQRVIDVAGNQYWMSWADWPFISIDASAPVSEVHLQGPASLNGWHPGTVYAWLHAQDNGAGVDKIFYTLDGGATQVFSTVQPQPIVIGTDGVHTLRFWAVDKLGNEETPKSVEIKIDTTAPVIKWDGTTPEPNANGWHRTAVEAKFSATDAASGVATLDPASPLRFEQEGRDLSRTLKATDNVGWETTFKTPPLNIDLTAPVTTPTVQGTTSSNGIYTGATRITLTPQDNLSGVQSTWYSVDGGEAQAYSEPFSVTADGDHVIEFWSIDKAGNVEKKQRLELSIDSTSPQTTSEVQGTEGDNGWFTGTVTVTLSTQDTGATTYFRLNGSESRAYTAPLALSKDGKHVLEFWSVDRAGNAEAKQTLNINIDTQLPSLSWGTPAPAANANGWNNAAVQIPFTTSDITSGVESTSTTSPLTLNGEGREQGTTVTVRDKAGNSAPFQSPRVNLDFTAPQTGATANGTAGNNGWLRSAATVTLSGSDALSGVQSTVYRINGGAAQTYSSPLNLTSGTYTLSFWSVDKAGNTEAAKSQSVKIDVALPSLTIAATPTSAKSTGKPLVVQVSGKLSDALSGLDTSGAGYSVVDEYGRSQPSGALSIAADGTYRVSITLEGSKDKQDRDGRIYTITTRGRDLAGNVATASINVVVK
jgi:hypothetical protein